MRIGIGLRNPSPAVRPANVTASLDQLSAGRFSLGLAVGGREDDYAGIAELTFAPPPPRRRRSTGSPTWCCSGRR